MLHPFAQNLPELSDKQLDEKLSELTKKYFQTRNPEARNQIQLMINSHKLEQSDRQIKARLENDNKGLDKLIDIS
jgi:ribosomal protein L29|tara:strand:+ start:98 stop:322 length:225 start_codon:yes stop_codon:yes gene_type:complete